MSSFSELQAHNNEIQVLVNNKDFKNDKLKKCIKLAKIGIYSNPNFEGESEQYIKQACRFSELNLMYILSSRNHKEYQNAINNVKFFYQNTLTDSRPQTFANHSMVTAIHLLFLLSTNQNQQFYSKLETIKIDNLNDAYISYVLLLNDAIEQGNYRKVFTLREQNPLADYFSPFLDTISETIRTEIAKSAEKAYSEISLKEALAIFQFDSVDKLRNFAQKYHESLQEHNVIWTIKEEKIYFQKERNRKVNFNSQDLIRKTLEYSIELERIA